MNERWRRTRAKSRRRSQANEVIIERRLVTRERVQQLVVPRWVQPPSGDGDIRQDLRQQQRLKWISIVFVIGAMIGGIILGARALDGFDPPDVSRVADQYVTLADQPQISFAIHHPSGDEKVALQYEVSDSYATYQIAVPIDDADNPWVLVLTGPAVLTHMHLPADAHTVKCEPDHGSPCQIIVGTKAVSPIGISFFDHCEAETAAAEVASNIIVVSGQLSISKTYNSDYTVATIPNEYDGTPDMPINDNVAEHLPAEFDTVPTAYCLKYDVPAGYDVSDTPVEPDYATEAELIWNTEPFGNPVVVLKDKNADAKTNAYIIGSGVVFAIGAGFIPVWIVASSELRRLRRRQERVKRLQG